MFDNLDVAPTAEVMRSMAEQLEEAAKKLRRQADALERTKELDEAASAISTVTNLFNNLRLDLLVARPVRALQRLVIDAELSKDDS